MDTLLFIMGGFFVVGSAFSPKPLDKAITGLLFIGAGYGIERYL